jgi:branched-chain amino acid aminotransferase
VRIIVTRGVAKAVVADPRDFDPTVIVWAAPYVFLADESGRHRGIRLHLSSLRGFRPDTLDPRYKCLDRFHYQLAKIEALEAGYDDVLWLGPDGYVSEGPASNVFTVSKGVLYTPGRGVLRGITRETFLELASDAGVPTRETDLSAFDLFSADEVFTSSTAGGALPVREVAGRPLRDPIPGPVTAELDRRYWELRDSGKYGTPIYD